MYMCQNNSSVNFLPGIARSAVILQSGGPLLTKMAFIPLSGVPVSWSAHQQYLWHCTILNLPSGVHCGIYIPPFGSTDCWLREDACSSKQLFLMTINDIFYLIYIVIKKSFNIWKVIDDKKQSHFFFFFFLEIEACDIIPSPWPEAVAISLHVWNRSHDSAWLRDYHQRVSKQWGHYVHIIAETFLHHHCTDCKYSWRIKFLRLIKFYQNLLETHSYSNFTVSKKKIC